MEISLLKNAYIIKQKICIASTEKQIYVITFQVIIINYQYVFYIYINDYYKQPLN